jgi:hypothetical protein
MSTTKTTTEETLTTKTAIRDTIANEFIRLFTNEMTMKGLASDGVTALADNLFVRAILTKYIKGSGDYAAAVKLLNYFLSRGISRGAAEMMMGSGKEWTSIFKAELGTALGVYILGAVVPTDMISFSG